VTPLVGPLGRSRVSFYQCYVRVSTMTAIYTDSRLQTKVHTDKRPYVHSARSSLTVNHPSTNRGRTWVGHLLYTGHGAGHYLESDHATRAAVLAIYFITLHKPCARLNVQIYTDYVNLDWLWYFRTGYYPINPGIIFHNALWMRINVVQWQNRTGGFVPARLARACSYITADDLWVPTFWNAMGWKM